MEIAKYEIEVGSHLIHFEDGVFRCTECGIEERVPDIFYKDGPASVQKYKYYVLGLLHRNPCAESTELEDLLKDMDGAQPDSVTIGDVSTTNGGPSITGQHTTMGGNSVVQLDTGETVTIDGGMPATAEDKAKIQKQVEIQRAQQEMREKMGL